MAAIDHRPRTSRSGAQTSTAAGVGPGQDSEDISIVKPLPVACPTPPEIDSVLEVFMDSYDSGPWSLGAVVSQFEASVRSFTKAEYVVGVSSCTSGLTITFAAMDFPHGAEVIVPSFTFAATGLALLWNRLTPVFVDCLPGTMTVDPEQVVRAIGQNTAAILPVNVFGLPPHMGELEAISDKYGLPLIMDSAQGLGSTFQGKPTGSFGLCEVFSLSPTKVISACEGGLITTNDRTLAERARSMRDYGKGPDGGGMIFKGLSARMSEFHASVGLVNLRKARSLIEARLRLIHLYRDRLGSIRGCRVQEFPLDRTSCGNYFVLRVGRDARNDRDSLQKILKERGIQTKRYFYPPMHSQKVFRGSPHRIVGDLPNTWAASLESLALPLYAHMTDEDHDRVCQAVESVLQ
jgi:dTDP-4-amino-4,6-dideoxygalactose transaminase